jgi:flagellar assembly protein FliH
MMRKWSPDQAGSPVGRPSGSTGIVRGAAADEVRSARFDTGFHRHAQLAPEVVEQLRAEAQAAGYAAGWAEGRRAAELAAREARDAFAAESAAIVAAQEATARRVLAALAGAVDRFEQRTIPSVETMQAQLVEAAFALAESIVGRELATATEPGRDAITRALAFAPAGRSAVARLHPMDAATLPSTAVIEGRDVVVVADPALAPGDAIVECDASTVESRIAAGLERARNTVTALVAALDATEIPRESQTDPNGEQA